MKDENGGQALRVAEAISDGTPIDWDQMLSAHPELEGTLDQFRALETIARAHAHSASPAPLDSLLARDRSPLPAQDLQETVPIMTWGPLRVLEKLGEGGFGEVHRAHDPSLRRDVALKLWRVSDERERAVAQRLLAEGHKLARVRHSNVLVVHGAAEFAGQPGMWTDLLRGRTLEEQLAEQGAFSAHEAALIGLDLCRALAAVHAAGLVHRDVKTLNVMREEGGRIVLMDFGAAAEASLAGEVEAQGTPHTMAPEQLHGTPATPATDLYGLGVLLYRLVTGRYPIEAKTLPEIYDAHARGLARPLRDLRPDLPMDFVRVVERALAPVPEERFSSAGAMERALAAVVGVEASPILPPVPRPARAGLDWRAVAVATAITAFVVAVVVRTTSERQDRPRGPVTENPNDSPVDAVAPLSVSAKLYRQTADGEDLLLSGARVSPGDGLVMDVRSSDSVHVYVLNEDAQGEVYALFPGPSFDLRNPLPGGVNHRLPGTIRGQSASWQVTSAGGKEHVVVLASRSRLAELERDIAGLPTASADRPVAYARLSAPTLTRLRGIGGVRVDPSSSASPTSRLSELLGPLATGATTRGGVWAWQFELENPKP